MADRRQAISQPAGIRWGRAGLRSTTWNKDGLLIDEDPAAAMMAVADIAAMLDMHASILTTQHADFESLCITEVNGLIYGLQAWPPGKNRKHDFLFLHQFTQTAAILAPARHSHTLHGTDASGTYTYFA